MSPLKYKKALKMPYGRNLSALNTINYIAIFLKTAETVF